MISKANLWDQKITSLREAFSPQRVAIRAKAEKDAHDLLEANLGKFNPDKLHHLLNELVSTDLVDGKLVCNRFGQAFRGAHADSVIKAWQQFNTWSVRLWQEPDARLERLLDDYREQKALHNAGLPLPTLILYLRDPSRYNIWLPALVRGLKRLSGFVKSSKTAAAYWSYNDAVNEVKKHYSLKPQEVDYILWQLDLA